VPTEQAKGREAAKKKKVFVKSEEGWIGGCLDWKPKRVLAVEDVNKNRQ
jgi:hypothetical protein